MKLKILLYLDNAVFSNVFMKNETICLSQLWHWLLKTEEDAHAHIHTHICIGTYLYDIQFNTGKME